jgi:hypothetical protein
MYLKDRNLRYTSATRLQYEVLVEPMEVRFSVRYSHSDKVHANVTQPEHMG